MDVGQDRLIRAVVSRPFFDQPGPVATDLVKARELVKAIICGVPEKYRANFIDAIAVLFNQRLGSTCSPAQRRYCLRLAERWVMTLMEEEVLEEADGHHLEIFEELLRGLNDTRLQGRVKKRLGSA